MKKIKKQSALKEQEGIEAPEIFSKLSIDKIVGFRKIQPSAKELITGILKHDKVVSNFELKSKTNGMHQESPEFLLLEAELKLQLEKAINDLPEKQRTVFLMNRMENQTYSEIAGLLDFLGSVTIVSSNFLKWSYTNNSVLLSFAIFSFFVNSNVIFLNDSLILTDA